MGLSQYNAKRIRYDEVNIIPDEVILPPKSGLFHEINFTLDEVIFKALKSISFDGVNITLHEVNITPGRSALFNEVNLTRRKSALFDEVNITPRKSIIFNDVNIIPDEINITPRKITIFNEVNIDLDEVNITLSKATLFR